MTKFNLVPKGKSPRAVMPPVLLNSLSAGIQLVVVDASGTAIPGVDPTTVTTTVVTDDAHYTVAAGADALHYAVTVPAGSTGQFTISATLAFNAGTPGPFTASVLIELPTPPPPVPVDLQIVITPS